MNSNSTNTRSAEVNYSLGNKRGYVERGVFYSSQPVQNQQVQNKELVGEEELFHSINISSMNQSEADLKKVMGTTSEIKPTFNIYNVIQQIDEDLDIILSLNSQNAGVLRLVTADNYYYPGWEVYEGETKPIETPIKLETLLTKLLQRISHARECTDYNARKLFDVLGRLDVQE